MRPEEPGKVKLFAGILYSDVVHLSQALALLIEQFGEMDYRSKSFPFDFTDYYESEMGSPIFRIFVSFEVLVHPKDLAIVKIRTNAIEDELAVDGKRLVNIDSGYMDYDKVVLASAKYNGQKIYLDHGIWADLTLHYENKSFDPYPWSFPDFKSGMYNEVFLEIRKKYKVQRKER